MRKQEVPTYYDVCLVPYYYVTYVAFVSTFKRVIAQAVSCVMAGFGDVRGDRYHTVLSRLALRALQLGRYQDVVPSMPMVSIMVHNRRQRQRKQE